MARSICWRHLVKAAKNKVQRQSGKWQFVKQQFSLL